jgi:hypothetical protein
MLQFCARRSPEHDFVGAAHGGAKASTIEATEVAGAGKVTNEISIAPETTAKPKG